MPTPPRRRWFRYSLASMFVLTALFAVGMAYVARERKIVRERLDMRERIIAGRGTFVPYKQSDARWLAPKPLPKQGFVRRLFGDEAVYVIQLPLGAERAEVLKARSLFPEARAVAEPGVAIETQ